MLNIMLMKHNSELLKQSDNRDADILFEKKIIVIKYFISNSRFDLKFKINTEFSASQQSNVINKIILSTK